MNSECLKEIFFLAILSFNNIVMSMQEDQVCTLPDGETNSTCVPLPQCKTLQDIVDKYNRTLPNDELDYLRKHYCGRNNDVCCPNVEYVPRIAMLPETVVLEEENGICTLPNSNRKSKCVFFDECNHFRNIVNTQLLTEDIIKDINMHSCKERGYVCCPDYVDDIFTTTEETTTIKTEITTIPILGILLPLHPENVPNKTDLNWVQNHQNFKLINDKTCGLSLGVNRVYNGFDVVINEMPWAVLLGYIASRNLEEPIEWKCGGSLISTRFVLSAAHCINKFLKFARLGELNISTEQDCNEGECADPVQDINISQKIAHPDYDIDKKINDIALLKLATPADISKKNVRTICLPVYEEVDFDLVSKVNRMFTIAGWGKMNDGKTNANVLQKAHIPYVEHSECIRKYIPHPDIGIYDTFICAGGHNKTDACKGDSGGSFSRLSYIPKGGAKIYLYGVILGGVKCALEDHIYPGIITDVRYYLDWILDNMSYN